MESSRRDLLNDVAEHRFILKIGKIHSTPVLVSHPKQVWRSLKRVFCFYYKKRSVSYLLRVCFLRQGIAHTA